MLIGFCFRRHTLKEKLFSTFNWTPLKNNQNYKLNASYLFFEKEKKKAINIVSLTNTWLENKRLEQMSTLEQTSRLISEGV